MSKNSPKNSTSAAPTTQERRANARYPFSASAEAVHLQADTRLNGRVSDSINPFPLGADVKIRIVKGNTAFLADGRVTYVASGMGMGLAFTKIEPERMQVLEQWLKEARGESSREATALEEDVVVHTDAASGSEPKYVLNELILTLIRKRVLSESEGNVLLKRLMH
jgi:hypothetical protein